MSSVDSWSDDDAKKLIEEYKKIGISEDLAFRTYSARLLGRDPELVLHGGGNTSVKSFANDLFGKKTPIIHIKGSGWDLATIEPAGHPAVSLNPLIELFKLNNLSDEEMVSIQRKNLLDINSPNPSVETLLHAFLPYKFVDHTHSVSLLALANQPNAGEICKNIFGDSLVIVPYVMPGFDLALLAASQFSKAKASSDNNGREIEGMILINHGLFTFGDTAKESYKRMIKYVNKANDSLPRKINLNLRIEKEIINDFDKEFLFISALRGLLGKLSKKLLIEKKWIFDIRNTTSFEELLNHKSLNSLISKGVATPDHVIRTKAKPILIPSIPKGITRENFDEKLLKWTEETEKVILDFIKYYDLYFEKNNERVGGIKTQLDQIPRLILFPGIGLIGIGSSKKESIIAADIGLVWIETLLSAESFGEFKPVNESDTFDLEYWSLEQAKLSKINSSKLKGNIVAITGGGGTIGSQIAKEFSKEGAEIIIIDKNENSAKEAASICGKNALGIQCDLTNPEKVLNTFRYIVEKFGGLDILISNAGAAWSGRISELKDSILDESIRLNLLAHQFVAKEAVRVFKSQDLVTSEGNKMGGQLLFNISKQAVNPGNNFGAYGIAKAGLMSLMKQYALEEGKFSIRSNGINADRIRSGILDEEMIEKRAEARGISKSKYMSGNLLNLEVRAEDVAKAFVSLSLMERTTGNILTVDGGNVAAMLR